MGTKKSNKLYAAAAALAVTASAVAPGLTADAATKVTVKSVTNPASISHYGGYTFAVKKLSLPKTVKVLLSNKKYENRSVKWGKVSYDKKYIGKYQTISGTVSGTTKKASIKVKLNNYPVDVVEPKLAPVAVGEKLNLPSTIDVKYKDGKVIARSAKSFNLTAEKTDKAGEMKLSYNYMGKNSSIKGSIAYEVKAAEITNVMDSVKEDTLSVSADVKFPAKDAKAQLLIFPGKDESKALPAIDGKLEGGKFTAEGKMIPDGTHSYSIKIGDVVTPAKEFKVDNAPKVEGAKALNLKQVEVAFNKDVDTTLAETISNYELKDSSGNAITISSADVNGKKVILTLSSARAQSTSAKLTIKNIKDSKGILVAEVTNDIKFIDVKSPEVATIEVVAPKVVRVNFSEPLETVPAFKLNNGATSIVNTAFTPGNDYVDLTIGVTPENGSKHILNVMGGTDFATFKVEDTTKEFTYSADTVAPTASVEVLSASQVKVKFNEDVSNLLNSNVKFYHTTKADAYELVKPSTVSGKEIILTLPNGQKLAEGNVKIILDYVSDTGSQVQDLFGNKFAEQELTGTFVADKTAPTITSIQSKSSTTLDVTFDETVTGATDKSNYVLKNAAGETVTISTIAVEGDASKNTFRLTTSTPLNGGNYTLTVKNITDSSSNKIVEVSKTVNVTDKVAPSLDSTTPVQLLADQKVKINFSESMDKSSIENKLNYLVGTAALNEKVTVVAGENNKSVILDFSKVTSSDDAAQSSIAGKLIKVLRVADAAGNVITEPSTTITVPGTATAPLFEKAEATGKNTVKLYFKEVITAAEADDFEVKVGNEAFTAAVSLSNEVVNGKSVITLTTADSLAGNISTNLSSVPVKVQTASSSTVKAVNSFGTKALLSDISAEDKFAPEIVGAVFSDVVDGDDTLSVTFSETLYAASVQEGDFSVAGRTVKAVNVTGSVARLTLSDDKIVSDSPAKISIVGSIEDANRNAKTSQEFTIGTPVAPTVTLAKATTAGKTKLSGTTSLMEYSVNGSDYVAASADVEVSVDKGDVVKVRTAATSTMNASAVKSLTVAISDIKEAAAPNAVAVNETAEDANDGSITGVSASMEYKLTDSSTWNAVTGNAITGLAPGSYQVRVKETTTKPASLIKDLTIEAFAD